MKRWLLLCSTLTLFAAPMATAWDVSGIVVHPNGSVAADVQLWASQDRMVQHVATDESGSFSFPDLHSGQLSIIAYKDGMGLGGVEGQLLSDETLTIQLTRPATVSLSIIDEYTEPVAGARLKWMRVNDYLTLNLEDLTPTGFPAIRSDEKGRMQIPFMPVRSHAGVAVSHVRHAEAHLPMVPVGQTIPLIMVDGVKLRGRVTNADGAGLSRARVTVFRTGEEREYKFSEVLTDADGFYSTTVPPAPYYVAAKHPDYGTPTPVPALVGTEEENVIADIAMPPAYWIDGMALDEQRNPVPFVRVAYTVDGAVYDEAVTDSNGAYRLRGNAGEAALRITAPDGMMTDVYPVIPVRVDDADLTVSNITILPLPMIRGMVTLKNGESVPGAIVQTLNTPSTLWARSNADGSFEIQLTDAQNEAVDLRTEHATRFLRQNATVNLRDTEDVRVTLRSYRPDIAPKAEGAKNDLSHMAGKDAPDWACDAWFNLPDGMESAMLTDLRDKVVVLTLWGGFDSGGPTRERMRELNELNKAFANADDVFFLAIHDASLEPVQVEQYVRDWDIAMPVGCDADPFLSFDTYNVNVIPQTVLIDKKGVLRYINVEGRLHELIKALRRD